MRPSDAKMSVRGKIYFTLIVIGFLIMEFPGVFFFQHKAEPYIFGFPFIYGFTLIMWAIMVFIIYLAYRDNWGEKKVDDGQKGGEAK